MYSLLYIHTHACTLFPFLILFEPLSLQAEISPVKCINNMPKTRSQHVAPCNRYHWFLLPTRSDKATGGNTQAASSAQICNAIAFEDPTHSRSDGAKAPIEIHISILVRK